MARVSLWNHEVPKGAFAYLLKNHAGTWRLCRLLAAMLRYRRRVGTLVATGADSRWVCAALDRRNACGTLIHTPSRGFLLWSLSDAGPGAGLTLAMGRHQKAFTQTALSICNNNATQSPRRHARVGRRDMSGSTATAVPDTELVAYIAEQTEPTESAAGIGIDELFADYLKWSKQQQGTSLRLEEFSRAFDALRASPELEGKIKKFGARYFGIALANGSKSRGRVQSVA
jgi:hypothetical protein